MKIAIVSTDGTNVNDHFGKAEKFLIYEKDDTGLVKVEERKSVPLSVNDPDHLFDKSRFDQICNVIHDCEKVVMTRIGDVPKEKLVEKGIEPIIFDGPIASIPL